MLSLGMRYILPGSRAVLRCLEDGNYLFADVVNSLVVAPASASFYQLDTCDRSLDHSPGMLRAEFNVIGMFRKDAAILHSSAVSGPSGRVGNPPGALHSIVPELVRVAVERAGADQDHCDAGAAKQ